MIRGAMPRHVLVLIIPLVLMAFGLTGCWDRIELNDQIFVFAAAADLAGKDEASGNDLYRLSLEVPLHKKMQMQGGGGPGGGGEGQKPAWIISGVGRTMFDITSRFSNRSNRRINYVHNKIIVIGEDLAREGIGPVLDFFTRFNQMERSVKVFIASGEGRKILNVNPKTENFTGIYLDSLARNESKLSRAAAMEIWHVMKSLHEHNAFLVPIVTPGEGEFMMAGLAIFSGEKMVGRLNDTETRGLLVMKGALSGGEVIVKVPGIRGFSSYMIHKSKTKITPIFNDNNLAFHVEISTQGNIPEYSGERLLDDPKLAQLEEEIAAVIAEQVQTTVDKARDLRVDFLGLNQLLEHRYPELWQQLSPRWQETLPSITMEVNVKVQVRLIGLDV